MSNFEPLKNYIDSLDINEVSKVRKSKLNTLCQYIQAKRDKSEMVNLHFICTHNSRRSHLAQIWAQSISQFYELHNITCYSGGTEISAVHPSIIRTLQNRGFQIHQIAKGFNPIYTIKFASNIHPIISFSKTWDDDFNPATNFAALMTCSDADLNCPILSGSDVRIPLNYEDPKKFDGTEMESIKYEERSHQIATEMKYVFKSIQKS